MNKNNGITLIALIMTIIVMIILVSVTVTIALNGGLFKRTQEGAFKSAISKLQEQVYGSSEINKYSEYTNFKIKETITIPNELKDFIDVLEDGTIVYINDINKVQYTWAKEMGILGNEELLLKTKIEELMVLAEKYIDEGNSSTDANLLVLQYIRRNKYTGGNWDTVAGRIDTTFVQYVETNKTSSLDINNLTDPVTGENIDFVHEMASLNVYLKNATSTDPLKQYSCWAGDLCTLVNDVYNFYKNGTYTDAELKEQTKSLLGGNSSFGLEDMLADVDAVNVSRLIISSKGNLNEILYNYYYGSNSDKVKNRYSEFAAYLKTLGVSSSAETSQMIYAVAKYYLGKNGGFWVTLYAPELINSYSSIPNIVFETVSTCFSEYICERI